MNVYDLSSSLPSNISSPLELSVAGPDFRYPRLGWSVAISGDFVLAGAPSNPSGGVGSVFVFDAQSGQQLRSFTPANTNDYKIGEDLSVLGNMVLVNGKYLFDWSSGQQIRTFQGQPDSNASGPRLGQLTDQFAVEIVDKTVTIFDKLTGQVLRSISAANNVTSSTTSGDFLALGSENAVAVYRLSTGTLAYRLTPDTSDDFVSTFTLGRTNAVNLLNPHEDGRVLAGAIVASSGNRLLVSAGAFDGSNVRAFEFDLSTGNRVRNLAFNNKCSLSSEGISTLAIFGDRLITGTAGAQPNLGLSGNPDNLGVAGIYALEQRPEPANVKIKLGRSSIVWQVWIDSNRNGVLDDQEPVLREDSQDFSNPVFASDNLAAGQYRLMLRPTFSPFQTAPDLLNFPEQGIEITLAAGQNLDLGHLDLFSSAPSKIVGRIFGMNSSSSRTTNISLYSNNPSQSRTTVRPINNRYAPGGSFYSYEIDVPSGQGRSFRLVAENSNAADGIWFKLSPERETRTINLTLSVIVPPSTPLPTDPLPNTVWGQVPRGNTNTRVWLDDNFNGRFDADEPSNFLDANGTYILRYSRTGPQALLASGISESNIVYFNASPGDYRNINLFVSSSIPPLTPENVIQGQVTGSNRNTLVWIDSNFDGLLDDTESSTFVQPDGTYRIQYQTTGPVRLLATGMTPAQGVWFTVFTPGEKRTINISVSQAVNIVRANVAIPWNTPSTLFLDTNVNGRLDPGEISTSFSFPGIKRLVYTGVGSFALTLIGPDGPENRRVQWFMVFAEGDVRQVDFME